TNRQRLRPSARPTWPPLCGGSSQIGLPSETISWLHEKWLRHRGFVKLTPAKKCITFAKGMFRDIWNGLLGQTEAKRRKLVADIQRTEQKIDQLMDRIVEAEISSIIAAYEKRIAKLETEKLVLEEKREKLGGQKHTFEEMFEHALCFLSNPRKLWDSGVLAHRQTVVKLAFREPPRYCRKSGFSNPEFALPFRLLGGKSMSDFVMAETKGFEPSIRG
ncbi:MAG: hypothetical protein AAF224_08545, partial [Pseudomonadota bacterium]